MFTTAGHRNWGLIFLLAMSPLSVLGVYTMVNDLGVDGTDGFSAEVEVYRIKGSLGPFVTDQESTTYQVAEPVALKEFLQSKGIDLEQVKIFECWREHPGRTCIGLKDPKTYVIQNNDIISVDLDRDGAK